VARMLMNQFFECLISRMQSGQRGVSSGEPVS
jgi:hypothetical protein